MKVFINPGHDVKLDSGAVNRNSGLREADVALKIGGLVQHYVSLAGCQTRLFQYDDLRKIVDTSDAWGADIFVSIHCNAFNQKARGTETYYYSGSQNGGKLANCIHKQIIDSLDIVDRGVKTQSFYVIRYTEAPAVLVETAFIDNDDDARLLVEKADEFARAIARGITDYEQA